jgi:diguanylate cyclase (GGDEF)-like protein
MIIRVLIATYVVFISISTVLLGKSEQPILTWCAGGLLLVLSIAELKYNRLRVMTLMTLFLFHWLSKLDWCMPLYIIYAVKASYYLKEIHKTIGIALLFATIYTCVCLATVPDILYHKLVIVYDMISFIAVAFGVSHFLKIEKERRELIKTNVHLITHDSLTGLLNFRECHEQLEYLTTIQRPFVFFLIDCNNLKSQNFEHGYVGGNQILIQVAQYLREAFPDSFLSSRYGGDEFALCLPVDPLNPKQIEQYCSRLETEFHSKLGIMISLGYSVYPVHGKSKDELLQHAENMLYTVKRERWLEREQQLLSSEKLRVVGELAAGMAHEIRNPMTTIKGFLQISKDRAYNIEPWYDLIMDEISRVSELTSELLQFSKPNITQYTRQSLHDLMKRVISLMESQALFQGHQILFHAEPTPIYAFIERDKMVQVLLNLMKNAFEAMKHPGLLTIRLYDHDGWAVIAVQDTGEGIAQEKLAHIFSPFYSTKENGTGLGLAICLKIVQDQGGTIEVDSTVGAGSTFRIKLPLDREST